MSHQSFSAVYDFIEANELETDPFRNCRFIGSVEYQWKGRIMATKTRVTFIRSGFNDGGIMLDENEKLNSDDFHLDFVPKFQSYSFSQSGNDLTISGSSDKMGGDYKVVIYL